MGNEGHRVTRENVFSPEAPMLEQAGGNAGVWSHMEALMGVRAGSSHQHPDRKLSPIWGTLCKFSLGLLSHALRTPLQNSLP